ncbi:MAG TPA: sigma-70 family RNA polymerase sigma factor [Sedimentisphaerales bacterium]|nr:sigma-70 family RNA polymerase sigma factor [Sedimentisphaerales bacterium]
MSEDQHLLRRLNRGDLDGLGCIYEKYKDDLLTIAMSVLFDVHAAEDCLHDVFVNFARISGDFHIHRSLKGYLIRCMINRAKNQLKKNQNLSACQIEEVGNRTTFSNPLGQLIEHEESIQVFKALAKLPNEQHEVVVLYLYGEMKFKEIADLLDISINTVQSRYRYGIEKLKALL